MAAALCAIVPVLHVNEISVGVTLVLYMSRHDSLIVVVLQVSRPNSRIVTLENFQNPIYQIQIILCVRCIQKDKLP